MYEEEIGSWQQSERGSNNPPGGDLLPVTRVAGLLAESGGAELQQMLKRQRADEEAGLAGRLSAIAAGGA